MCKVSLSCRNQCSASPTTSTTPLLLSTSAWFALLHYPRSPCTHVSQEKDKEEEEERRGAANALSHNEFMYQ